MCKICIISGIKDETKDNAWAFIREMSKQMSKPNTVEDDGFGYAAIDNEGNLFGERWLKNNEAFKHQEIYGLSINSNLMKKFKILSMDKVYNSFGTFNENIRSITMHSRTSTNTVALKNVHPFVDGFTSVIHNGVIYNDDKLIKKTSTCDSETIVHEYNRLNVRNKIGRVKKLVNRLEGYYAMGIFSKKDNGPIILDIIKDDNAKLEAYYIKELETIVFATPGWGTFSIVENACKTLGFTIQSKIDVRSNKLQRIDALTGETIGYESFKPKQFTRKTWSNNNDTRSNYPYAGYGNYDDNYERSIGTPSTSRGGVSTWDMENKRWVNASDIKKEEPKNNVSYLPTKESHSASKHKDMNDSLERELEDILQTSRDFSEEEIKRLQDKYFPKIIQDLQNVNGEVNAESFNNSGNTEWEMDERFTWRKKG